jgi:response regulator of citrate/malate metabolism
VHGPILRTVLVDDEPIARQVLEDEVTETPGVVVVGQPESSSQAGEVGGSLRKDLVCLGIQVPKRRREFFIPRVLRKEKLSVSDLDTVLAFAYHPQDPGAVAQRLSKAFTSLLVPGLLIDGLAFEASRRYPVSG